MTAAPPPGARGRAYAAWILVCLVWGTTYLAIRVALETVPPMLMAGIRYVTAGTILVAVVAARRESLPARQAWPSLALLGVLMTTVGNGGVVWAEQTLPSGLVALLVAAIPFWMVGVERLMPRPELVSPGRMVGLIVGFAGIAVLVWPEVRHPTVGAVAGVAATQLACVGWSIGSIYTRRRSGDESLLGSAAMQMLFGGAVLLTVGLLAHEWRTLRFSPRSLAAVAYLVVMGSVVAYSAYLFALRNLPVSIVSLYAYVNPIIAVALGTAILGEPFGPRLAVAGGIVLLGMLLVKRA